MVHTDQSLVLPVVLATSQLWTCSGLAVWGVLVPLVVVGAHELADTQTLDKTEFPLFVEGIDADQGLHSHAALAI